MFELTIIFKHEMIIRIKWNFELTVFELSVPDLNPFLRIKIHTLIRVQVGVRQWKKA